jgi:uncharacterized protein YjaG (DUF416 family)
MPEQPPDTFDAYERRLAENLRALSGQQRLAFLAALAERSVADYEKFTSKEGWGDPATLRRIGAAVWTHLQEGRALVPAERARHSDVIKEHAPDTEDFDGPSAWKALQACVILGRALDGCANREDAAPAGKAALDAFQAAVGDWPSDPAGQRRAWKKAAAQKEFAFQSDLLQTVRAVACFDEAAVKQLRGKFAPAKTGGRTARAGPPKKARRVDDDSVEGWRAAVHAYLSRSPAHRIAFAAAVAERLLPHYRAYASAAGSGRPERLSNVVEAVWQAARDPSAAAAIVEEHQAKLRQAAPGDGEPGGWDAWSAWRVCELALACCASADNAGPAGEAAVVAFERVAGRGARDDPKAWKDQHRRPEVHGEVMKQMTLLMRLRALPALDEQTLQTLRPQS